MVGIRSSASRPSRMRLVCGGGRATGHCLQRDERDLGESTDAQKLQHVHQLSIGYTTIGAQEDALLAPFGRAFEGTNEIGPFDRSVSHGDDEVRLDGNVDRVVEVAVKNSSRPDGKATPWAYYNFTDPSDPAKVLASATAFPDQSCANCHQLHASNDNVWVQFYPALRDARR
jgi:Cytochrome P460